MNETNEFAVINRCRETLPVDIDGLCKKLGIKVHMAFLHPAISGMIESKGHGKFTISVNASDPLTRRRFTMAHELGHYMLHRSLIGDGIDDDRAYRSTNKGKYHNTEIGPHEETEANKFAADVLMPWVLIDECRNRYIGDPGKLARNLASKFRVSHQAMTIRLS